ncbi:hypothetical protein GQ53DRAFT_131512 [Thozetella sp. PMI_491]|nr:hypothetical protein GQ53DRAFT_131512 [Thozetella sp. PMI_491]
MQHTGSERCCPGLGLGLADERGVVDGAGRRGQLRHNYDGRPGARQGSTFDRVASVGLDRPNGPGVTNVQSVCGASLAPSLDFATLVTDKPVFLSAPSSWSN